MGCGRARVASAVAEPAPAPARHAGSLAKLAAFHSSVQPESCRFNFDLAQRPLSPIAAGSLSNAASPVWGFPYRTSAPTAHRKTILMPPGPESFQTDPKGVV